MQKVSESSYPLTFRQEDAAALGERIRRRDSVEIIGMKRVGISNFLRFFLYNTRIKKEYIHEDQNHLFIPVDLNDLSEREIIPFWLLTLKRIVDASEDSSLSKDTKDYLSQLFLSSIQTKDLFLTVDNIRSGLMQIYSEGVIPTIFFLRFDRLKDVVTEEVFANLQGFREVTDQQLAFVFTSYRSLDDLFPAIQIRHYLSPLDQLFLKPADPQDRQIISQTFEQRHGQVLSDKDERIITELADGHVQYLQLALISLAKHTEGTPLSKKEIEHYLRHDEQISLLTEEIWESLSQDEKTVLTMLVQRKPVTEDLLKKAKYLFDTGILHDSQKIFNKLFEHTLKEKTADDATELSIELSKKENQLYMLLLEHEDTVCERDRISDVVWPEYAELGVSDWTIDRLIARLRTKLKQRASNYAIVTVKTRGYKLVKVE